MFTGDILLSRQVQAEIERTGASPWVGFSTLFTGADWVAGNFEGALGPATDCLPHDASPCFAAPPSSVTRLASAGFDIVTLENNHAADLGKAGRLRTHDELRTAGVLGLDFEHSPRFMRTRDVTVALIAVTTVRAADGQVQMIPSAELGQKLRLAHSLASVVIVSVHWGLELQDWRSTAQQQQAEWLVDHGADLIVGHHPHVVQKPECVHGHPVFFSLGNHVFDQKYLETKSGLIADCRIASGRLRCGGIRTQTRVGSAVPVIQTEGDDLHLSTCEPPINEPLVVGGIELRASSWLPANDGDGLTLEGWKGGKRLWSTATKAVLSIQAGLSPTAPGDLLLALERHRSSMDEENGIRPYVYAVTEQGLVAKWRGSALAWPLIDASVDREGRLCALHRGDAFMRLDTASHSTRTMRYQWNGFGFSASPDSTGACAAATAPGTVQAR